MKISEELEKLNIEDIYSLLLFVLYKSTEIPQYSTLSQLAYILDKDSLLKLCEFYGGMTIKVPTIEELEELLNGLLIFQLVEVERQSEEDVHKKFSKKAIASYSYIREIMKKYKFASGRS